MRVLMKVPYFVPWISREDKKSVVKVLNQRWLTNGPVLKKFEEKFRCIIGSKYSAGVGSATHALHLAVKSLGIEHDDEVIVPTFTFVATANAAANCGAEPVLVDVDPNTFNISTKEIEKKITKRTKAIIVVHYAGQACDMDEITSIAKKHGLYVIEDCAHALGSKYKKQFCGNIGNVGCFSFYPTKIITTGEGGMVTTNLVKIADKVKLLRSQGMSVQAKDREASSRWKYDIVNLGYNYRLDEVRAALGLSQLQRIERINEMREKIAKKYNKMIEKIKGLNIPKIKPDRNHIFHLYTIKVEKNYPLTRNQLFKKLSKNGIGTSVQYYPLHLMSIYKNQSKKSNFPVANKLKDKVISLPIFPKMTTKQIEYVVSQLK